MARNPADRRVARLRTSGAGLRIPLLCAALLSGSCSDDESTAGAPPDGGQPDASSTCGNNTVDGVEICDGEDLAGERCSTLGFGCGVLQCAADCMGFDTTGCTDDCTIALSATHPRLFVGPDSGAETLATLRARCGLVDDGSDQYQNHEAEYAAVREAADLSSYATRADFDGARIKNQGRVALASAFCHLMEQDAGCGERARWLLENLSSWEYNDDSYFAFYHAALIYDWIYDALTPADRASLSAAMIAFVEGSPFFDTAATFSGNYNQRKYYSGLISLVGQAIYDEEPAAAEAYWNQAYAMWERLNAYSREITADGFIYPIGGASYADESGWLPHLRMVQALRFTGLTGAPVDGLDLQVASSVPYGAIYSFVYDGHRPVHDDAIPLSVGPLLRFGPELPLSFSHLAKLHEGDERGRLASYVLETFSGSGEEQVLYVGSILFNDKNANAVGSTVQSLPSTRVFDDTILAYRSGWEGLQSDNDEVYFSFHCPKQVNGHTHYAKGHVNLWRGRDALTFQTGGYASAEPAEDFGHYYYGGDSLAHNVFLCEHAPEDSGARPNDGGQLTNAGDGASFQDTDHWQELGSRLPGAALDLGSIERSRVGDEFFYAYFRGVEGKLYHADKMDGYSRTVARMGDFFVVLDRFDGDAGRTDTKRQIWHAPAADQGIEGGTWQGSAPDESDGSTRGFHWDAGGSRLHIHRVFPAPSATAVSRRVGGGPDNGQGVGAFQYYSRAQARNYEGDLEQGDPHWGLWRLELEQTGEEDGVFLTVLYPCADGQAMPVVHPLGSATAGNFVGTELGLANGDSKVVILSNDVSDGLQSAYSFALQSTSGTADILAGDLTASTYSITGQPAQQTDSGTLYFTAPLSQGSSFTIQ